MAGAGILGKRALKLLIMRWSTVRMLRVTTIRLASLQWEGRLVLLGV